MSQAYEKVHTMTDYYDGPRRGIADFDGNPHLYVSEWNDLKDDFAPTFVLSPVDEEVLRLVLEDWAIWRRWESAFHQGLAKKDTHPALPADRARHEELKALLADRLNVDPARSFTAIGHFQRRDDPEWDGLGFAPLEVRWELLDGAKLA